MSPGLVLGPEVWDDVVAVVVVVVVEAAGVAVQ